MVLNVVFLGDRLSSLSRHITRYDVVAISVVSCGLPRKDDGMKK